MRSLALVLALSAPAAAAPMSWVEAVRVGVSRAAGLPLAPAASDAHFERLAAALRRGAPPGAAPADFVALPDDERRDVLHAAARRAMAAANRKGLRLWRSHAAGRLGPAERPLARDDANALLAEDAPYLLEKVRARVVRLAGELAGTSEDDPGAAEQRAAFYARVAPVVAVHPLTDPLADAARAGDHARFWALSDAWFRALQADVALASREGIDARGRAALKARLKAAHDAVESVRAAYRVPAPPATEWLAPSALGGEWPHRNAFLVLSDSRALRDPEPTAAGFLQAAREARAASAARNAGAFWRSVDELFDGLDARLSAEEKAHAERRRAGAEPDAGALERLDDLKDDVEAAYAEARRLAQEAGFAPPRANPWAGEDVTESWPYRSAYRNLTSRLALLRPGGR